MDQGTGRDGSFRRVHQGEHAVSALYSRGDWSSGRFGVMAAVCA